MKVRYLVEIDKDQSHVLDMQADCQDIEDALAVRFHRLKGQVKAWATLGTIAFDAGLKRAERKNLKSFLTSVPQTMPPQSPGHPPSSSQTS